MATKLSLLKQVELQDRRLAPYWSQWTKPAFYVPLLVQNKLNPAKTSSLWLCTIKRRHTQPAKSQADFSSAKVDLQKKKH